MSGGVNKCVLIGNLGRDAELKYTTGGSSVASFSLACSETWRTEQGEKKERTEWVNCVLWGKQAESLVEYLKKGKQVYVEGKLQTREWTTREGDKRKTTEVRVERVTLLGGGGRDSGRQENATPPVDDDGDFEG